MVLKGSKYHVTIVGNLLYLVLFPPHQKTLSKKAQIPQNIQPKQHQTELQLYAQYQHHHKLTQQPITNRPTNPTNQRTCNCM